MIVLTIIITMIIVSYLIVLKTANKAEEIITREYAKNILYSDGNLLKNLKAFKNDKELAIIAIRQQGNAICYVGEELLKDKDVIFEAIMRSNFAINFIPKSFLSDKEFVLEAASMNGKILAVARDFRDDYEVALKAIQNNGLAIKYVSKIFTNQIDFILKALQNKNDKEVMFYASKEIQDKVKKIDPFFSDPLLALEIITNSKNLSNTIKDTIKLKHIKI